MFLTYSRIVLGCYICFSSFYESFYVESDNFVLCSISDYLDGFLQENIITNHNLAFDPIADKILLCCLTAIILISNDYFIGFIEC